jgi:hypothetical protein
MPLHQQGSSIENGTAESNPNPNPILQGVAIVVDTRLGFSPERYSVSPERFSGSGIGVWANESIRGTVVAPDLIVGI